MGGQTAGGDFASAAVWEGFWSKAGGGFVRTRAMPPAPPRPAPPRHGPPPRPAPSPNIIAPSPPIRLDRAEQ